MATKLLLTMNDFKSKSARCTVATVIFKVLRTGLSRCVHGCIHLSTRDLPGFWKRCTRSGDEQEVQALSEHRLMGTNDKFGTIIADATTCLSMGLAIGAHENSGFHF